MKHVGSNTLVLTNSPALFQIIKPKKVVKSFIQSKFVFPEQEDFKFFSSDKVLLSSAYEEARKAFDSELFGFFGNNLSLTEPQPCLTNISQFEQAIKDISYHTISKTFGKIPQSIVHEDNESCLKFATMPKMSLRTKHNTIPYHFFRTKVELLEI